jgi:hypothetical protein
MSHISVLGACWA